MRLVVVALPTGTVLGGDYEILQPLAEGGMGAVYVAEQRSTGRRRALKLMHAELARDVRAVERFAQEARVGARIESEHVVEVVGAGVDAASGMPWLAMELLDGSDLASLVAKRGALPRVEAFEILEQACDAVAKAHAHGVVHRDLKPENVFVAVSHRRGVPFTVKILDFGISKLLHESQAAATATSTIGSPLWMAPEQADRKGKIGPSTDVWALGLITFFMLSGRSYWLSANEPDIGITALLREVLIDPMVTASERARELGCAATLPDGFDAWFARCASRPQSERFAHAAELMDAARAVFAIASPPVALGSSGSIASSSPIASSSSAVAATQLTPASTVASTQLATAPAPVASTQLAPAPIAARSVAKASSGPRVAVIGAVLLAAAAVLLGGTVILFRDGDAGPRQVSTAPPIGSPRPAEPASDPTVDPPDEPASPPEDAFQWGDGDSFGWAGSWTSTSSSYALGMSLRRTGSTIDGQLDWRRIVEPGAPPSGGTEWVRGTYDDATGRLDLAGYRVSGDVGLDVYRLRIDADGDVRGSTRTHRMDWSGRLEAELDLSP